MTKYGSPQPIADHGLSIATAIAIASKNIVMPPPNTLASLERTQITAKSSEEYGEYMQEPIDQKNIEVRRGERIDGKELHKGTLSQDDVRGNTFVMLAAGHETSAGVLQFIFLELEDNAVSQRSLHGTTDEICGDGDHHCATVKT
ncbi:uncharacterized protein FFB20_09487 [Fusarium fujikuroi]|uniref:Uncharacterized protein n=2 Tax=Fusarium fujikuroi TaxID=5127 RepID=S0E1J0_GIBF5|nr:uncharacterized protein FFUJ_07546 [Fusarium fujikuroi IMI 58289]KLP16455.1 uncharacterized protein LW94_547 [Fusarium fujikuroi]CCT68734.1 uncharacterized protein FFUJ_07546 [Fusarium fujikuroi IMI 58289]SCN85124.1 uncharacterized protein FFE2_05602 [Fusarium fujikuroi]SCN91480.1 uncharacterized protein FFM5_05049 [Fusarium fujikuroi]SCN93597.1 uncharacterized protein FFB20_09487 [Fusarium fujikuroi]